jgi:hypothetical protein
VGNERLPRRGVEKRCKLVPELDRSKPRLELSQMLPAFHEICFTWGLFSNQKLDFPGLFMSSPTKRFGLIRLLQWLQIEISTP